MNLSVTKYEQYSRIYLHTHKAGCNNVWTAKLLSNHAGVFRNFSGVSRQVERTFESAACCLSDLKATSPLSPALWINPSLMMWMSSSSCSERLMLPCLDVDTAVRHRFVLFVGVGGQRRCTPYSAQALSKKREGERRKRKRGKANTSQHRIQREDGRRAVVYVETTYITNTVEGRR